MMRDAVLALRFPLAFAALLYFAANMLTGTQACRMEQPSQCPEFLK